ncbi:hypothetical protein BH10PLA2_BH10PLA2_19100 [soil metagenome]
MSRRHESAVELVTKTVERRFGLRKEGSAQIYATLLKEIPAVQLEGTYYHIYVFIQAAKLAETRPELFSDKNVRQAIVTEGKRYKTMEAMIRAAGYFPSEDEQLADRILKSNR